MLIDILKNTRSIRLFDYNIKVPISVLKKAIAASVFAPTIYNLQPLKYRIVSDGRPYATCKTSAKKLCAKGNAGTAVVSFIFVFNSCASNHHRTI